ncbi:MAG TPA: DHH family phosphoesterase, partial [Candidatus Bilamarchaeaceae archaeon]|nr:DHH family phosphoesterase [Candidatus Bilamarchaeaceae archaeon]
LRFFYENREKRFVFASHMNADIDALSSIYALHSVFPNSVMAIDGKMDEPGRIFAERAGISPVKLSSLRNEDYDGLVVADTSAPSMLKSAEGWRILMIIDHHRENENSLKADIVLRDSSASATAEMVAGLLPSVSKEAAFALACGIVSDSARFKGGRTNTFKTLVSMMEIAGVDYPEVLGYGEPEPSMELKELVLRSLKKMRVERHGGYMISTVKVRDDESFVASALSDFADAAFVGRWKRSEGETKVSARGRKGMPVPLNEVMAQIGREFGGAGGGHAKAAGASAKGRPEIVLKRCVEILKGRL